MNGSWVDRQGRFFKFFGFSLFTLALLVWGFTQFIWLHFCLIFVQFSLFFVMFCFVGFLCVAGGLFFVVFWEIFWLVLRGYFWEFWGVFICFALGFCCFLLFYCFLGFGGGGFFGFLCFGDTWRYIILSKWRQ